MAARSFVWLSTGGGAWSLASNWDDMSDGISPSPVTPGAADSVMIAGPTGAALQTITGSGAVAAALFTGNTMLSGSFSFGSLSLGQVGASGLLELGASSALACGTADVVSGSLLVGTLSTLSDTGTLTLGDTASASTASMNLTGGGTANVAALFLGSANDSIYVDPLSVLEVGGSSGGSQARAGQLTIDGGGVLSGQGDANAFGTITNNGTIAAQGGTLSVGKLTGTGTLAIGAGSTLALDAACAAGQAVIFTGNNATLALAAEFDAPSGSVTGLATGDAIDVRGSVISSATYVASSATTGVLSLYYGTQVAVSLQLIGSYANDVFLTAGDGAGGTLVTLAPGGGGGGTVSPGTPTADQYVWTPPGSGKWNAAANWSDTTRHLAVAGIAPGINDLVTIAASASYFTVISGPANAASLALTGELALLGAYAIGALTAGQAAGATFTAGTLDLLGGTTIATASAWVADGAVSLSGSASVLTVSGTLTLGGGASGVGLPTAALSVTAGGDVQAANLVMGGGSGASIVTDPTGIVEVGTAGGAHAGAVTVDAAATLSGNGSVDPLGTVVDNGTILATGGTLTVGAVSGSGSLVVAGGATLELLGPSADPILLQGTSTNGSVLAFGNERIAPAGIITGFGLGDLIHLEGSSLTALLFAPSTGVLSLLYGSTVVARLTLAGSFANEHFVFAPDGSGGTLIAVTNGTGGGGSGGQAGTDTLAWTSPVSGGWSRAGNWSDLTTAAPATLPPGPQTQAQIAGPTGIAFQDITGTGTCASLSASGNSLFSGSFATGTLSLTSGATVVLGPATTLAASQAVVTGADLLASGTAAQLSITGTLALAGAGAMLSAAAKGGILCGTLSLSGGAVTADSVSWIDIGTTSGSQAGAITIDAGAQASGWGALGVGGTVIDQGSLTAQGGTLMVGAVSGGGTLGIGTEATLGLAATDSTAIACLGGGATLLLEGPAMPTSVITGFAPGDAIVLADTPIDSVTYGPGAAGLGTLTLSEAGQTVATLVLAGSYAGEVFGVQPDGSGAEITVQAGPTGPPAGTVAPDQYVWTGGQGSGAWSAAGNWTDVTQAQRPAWVAPGQNDLVSIAGGTGTALQVTGPANAAWLSLSGTVMLGGVISVGTLSVGSATASGVLALATGANLAAASGGVAGGITLEGGVLSVAGTLVLGAGSQAGALIASGGGVAELGSIVMSGGALAADASSAIVVGNPATLARGVITVAAGALLQGSGSVALGSGAILDQGMITASGGTLLLGNLSGGGTLEIGVGANLWLTGSDNAALTADFAGGGTLTLAQPALAAAPMITGFGTGDAILLAVGGATGAFYTQTAPGLGVVSIDDGSQLLAQITLLGNEAGQAFSVSASPATGAAGGFTILTTEPVETTGPGGIFMTNPSTSGGTSMTLDALVASLQPVMPYATPALSAFAPLNSEIYDWFSVDGTPPPGNVSGLAGVEVVGPLPSQTGGGGGPGVAIAMQPGFGAVLLEGTENVDLTDNGLGNALLVGNYGADQIAALGDYDTLVGATGANTLFYASLPAGAPGSSAGADVTVLGGGNDTIATNNDAADITTSDGHSEVFLGAPQTFAQGNNVVLNGADTVVCGGVGDVTDNITVNAAAGLGGNLVFGAANSQLNFVGGNTASTMVGASGQIQMQGGSANGNVLWCGGAGEVSYVGQGGSAVIVAGSGQTFVQGGAGPVTVFGGTGEGNFSGSAGSVFVVGDGATTVQAATGVSVYVTGNANVSVAGGAGASVYGGTSTGDNVFQATAGNETLWGGLGSDLFLAGPGNALLVSGGGTDEFRFTAGLSGGSDTIAGFVPGQDTLELDGYGPTPPPITYAFGDSILNLSDGTQIVVYGVANLTASSIVTG